MCIGTQHYTFAQEGHQKRSTQEWEQEKHSVKCGRLPDRLSRYTAAARYDGPRGGGRRGGSTPALVGV